MPQIQNNTGIRLLKLIRRTEEQEGSSVKQLHKEIIKCH